MRFSIKWMLRATAVVAAMCASTMYATQLWIDAIHVLLFVSLVAAALTASLRRGKARAFGAGYATTCLALLAALYFTSHIDLGFARTWRRLADQLVEHVPTRNEVALHYVSKQPGGSSVNRSFFRLSSQPNEDGDYVASFGDPQQVVVNRQPPSGYGSPRGRGGYGGYTVKTVAPPTFKIPAATLRRVPEKQHVEFVVRQHLLLLASLLGGVIGLWIQPREVSAATVSPPATHSPT